VPYCSSEELFKTHTHLNPKNGRKIILRTFGEFHPISIDSVSSVFSTCLKFFVLSFRGGQPLAGMDRSQQKKIFCLCDENGEKMVLENCL
jgi:hypothetical protein